MRIGTTSINIITDGALMVDGGSMFGQIPRTEWEHQIKPDRRNRVKLGLNCLLINTPDKCIVVDTGAGSKRTERLKESHSLNGNKFMRGLRDLDLTARDVDMVLLTHLQYGHSGGCTKLDRTGGAVPMFPKAKHFVQRKSWEEAIKPNERYAEAFFADDFLPLQEKGLLELLDGDSEVAPGIFCKVSNGPSNGHQIILVECGSERIAFCGDLIPTPYHLPLTYISANDEFPNESLEQKRELLDMAITDGWLMVFGHGFEHRSGYIEKRNGIIQLVPKDV